jgi:hypothetical protein
MSVGPNIPKMWLATFWELCGQFRYVAQAYIPSLKSPPQRIPTPHKFV